MRKHGRRIDLSTSSLFTLTNEVEMEVVFRYKLQAHVSYWAYNLVALNCVR